MNHVGRKRSDLSRKTVEGVVRSARAQQSVPIERRVQANGTGRHLLLAVTRQLHQSAPVDIGPRQLRRQRVNRCTAKQRLQRFLVRQKKGSKNVEIGSDIWFRNEHSE